MKRYPVLFALLAFAGAQLFGADQSAKPTPPAAPATKAAAPAETGYWLTIKSGIRHNSKCKYYKHSNGRPCTKDEGRACKLCGG